MPEHTRGNISQAPYLCKYETVDFRVSSCVDTGNMKNTPLKLIVKKVLSKIFKLILYGTCVIS